MAQRTLIRDPVHGDITFDGFEMAIINTPQFQRMRGIRQLGLAHLLYPGAQHSRFEHTLGVAHMAGVIVDAVNENQPNAIAEDERRFVRAMALIHDIGHVPFGHTLEDERPVFPEEQHHDGTERVQMFLNDTELSAKLQILGDDIGHPNMVDDLVRVMKGTHNQEGSLESKRDILFADIVANTICADLLDYLARDTFFTGLQHRYDQRIISAFKLDGNKIYLDLDDSGTLRHSVVSEILGLLRLRYTLGERIYYHPIKNVSSAMVSKAVELAGLTHKAVAPLRDEELLYVLENGETIGKLGKEEILNTKLVASLVKLIRARNFYIAGYSISADGEHGFLKEIVAQNHPASAIASRQKGEAAIAKKLGVDPSDIIIFCPGEKMAAKAAAVRVKWPHVLKIAKLEEVSAKRLGTSGNLADDEIKQLKAKHRALWRMVVYVSPALKYRLIDVKAVCQEHFYNLPDGDNPLYSDLRHAAKEQLLEAIATSPDLDSLDIRLCMAMAKTGEVPGVPAGSTIQELQKHLPRRVGVLSKAKIQEDTDVYHERGALFQDDDFEKAIKQRTVHLRPVYQEEAGQELRDLVQQLTPERRARFFNDLDSFLNGGTEYSQNRLTKVAFMKCVRKAFSTLQSS